VNALTSTSTVEDAVQHRGRSLDNSRDVALREATLGLLAEIGYDRLTIDGVAARAHAGKTTIYRRWPGKAELVVDALNCLKGTMTVPDTGSLQGDLDAIARGSSGTDNQFDARLMMGLITALAHDAELRLVFRERLIDPRQAILKSVFERAIIRGEVAADRNLDLVASLFPALMLQHFLTYGETPQPDFAEQVMNDVIIPLATAPGVPVPCS
jgi:AcrR family transcriptional regulator